MVRPIGLAGEAGEGVSHWLFLGLSAASVGFIADSVVVGNWVFTVTKACILALR